MYQFYQTDEIQPHTDTFWNFNLEAVQHQENENTQKKIFSGILSS